MDFTVSPVQIKAEQLLVSDFPTAARAVVAFLRTRLEFNLWMVTRVDGDDWIALVTEDHGYGVSNGDLFRWSDSFCSRMVVGLGPRIAPDSNAIPAFAVAPIGRQVPIGAYVGVPIHSGGEIFGTLCGIHPTAVADRVREELPLVELLAGLLGGILLRERMADADRRRAERAEVESMTDPLTGLTNRRGWEQLVEREEERSRRYGDPVSAVAIDLDGLKRVNDSAGHAAGDELLKRAANALRAATRESDVIARLGGDEFGILFVGDRNSEVNTILTHVRNALAEAGVEASLGAFPRSSVTGLAAAFSEADRLMLEEKRVRKARREFAA